LAEHGFAGRHLWTQRLLFGEDGHDLLVGGNSGGAIIGGAGSDLVLGGAGREFLVGGHGADAIIGCSADDILVAGYTSYDANATAVCHIYKERARTDRLYLDRIKALTGQMSGYNGTYTVSI
jgi:Ca2+-binding RTX toxin-like protein